jgi:hypothetical protein
MNMRPKHSAAIDLRSVRRDAKSVGISVDIGFCADLLNGALRDTRTATKLA